tara:strand:+ start:3084 stop:3464 length:381 start_codon:yes stop_codon:yes gene_type:complete
MTEEEEAKTMQDKVDEMTTTTFSIAGCPIKVFKEFMHFCEENAKVTKIFYNEGKKEIKEELCYSIGLKQLLDIANKNAVVQMLFDRVIKLEDESAMVQMESNPEQPKRAIKTFGTKEEVKEDVKAK